VKEADWKPDETTTKIIVESDAMTTCGMKIVRSRMDAHVVSNRVRQPKWRRKVRDDVACGRWLLVLALKQW